MKSRTASANIVADDENAKTHREKFTVYSSALVFEQKAVVNQDI
jgi:hypothetical protein